MVVRFPFRSVSPASFITGTSLLLNLFVAIKQPARITSFFQTQRSLRLEASTTASKMSPPFNSLTYYSFSTPNGLKPAIVLHELGLDYKPKWVDITKGQQKEQSYLDINPNGRIPALKDGDMRVFESGAIMLYLTDHYDKEKKISYETGSAEYYEMLSWLMFQMGGLGPMQGQANHFRAMAGAYSEYGINRYVSETKRLFDVLESRLSKADWLAGDKYTLADIANYAWVAAAPLILELDLATWPGVDKWVKTISAREGVKAAKAGPGYDSGRSEEDIAKMFKGMRERVDAMKGTDKHDS